MWPCRPGAVVTTIFLLGGWLMPGPHCCAAGVFVVGVSRDSAAERAGIKQVGAARGDCPPFIFAAGVRFLSGRVLLLLLRLIGRAPMRLPV